MFQMSDITRTRREPINYQPLLQTLTGISQRQEQEREVQEQEEREQLEAERRGRIAETLHMNDGDLSTLAPDDLSWVMAEDPRWLESVRGIVAPPSAYDQARTRYLDAQVGRWEREAETISDPGSVDPLSERMRSLQLGLTEPGAEMTEEDARNLAILTGRDAVRAVQGFRRLNVDPADPLGGVDPLNYDMARYAAETGEAFDSEWPLPIVTEADFIGLLFRLGISPHSQAGEGLIDMYREARRREIEGPPILTFRQQVEQGRPRATHNEAAERGGAERRERLREELPMGMHETVDQIRYLTPVQTQQIRDQIKQGKEQGFTREQIIEMLGQYVSNPEDFFDESK